MRHTERPLILCYAITFCQRRWATVEEESGIQLVHNTGAIQLARKNEKDQAIHRMIRSMEDNNMR